WPGMQTRLILAVGQMPPLPRRLVDIQLATRFAFWARPTRHLSVLQIDVHFASASFSSTRSTSQGASIPRICRYSSRSCIPTFWHPHIVTHYKVGIPLLISFSIL